MNKAPQGFIHTGFTGNATPTSSGCRPNCTKYTSHLASRVSSASVVMPCFTLSSSFLIFSKASSSNARTTDFKSVSAASFCSAFNFLALAVPLSYPTDQTARPRFAASCLFFVEYCRYNVASQTTSVFFLLIRDWPVIAQ